MLSILSRPVSGNCPETDCVTSGTAKRRIRRGIWVSTVFHVALLTTLLVWYVGRPDPDSDPSTATASSGRGGSAPAAPARDPGLRPKKGQKSSDTVREKLAELADASRKRSEEENLNELDKELARLAELSNPESIDQIATRFEGWFETPQRKAGESTSVLQGKEISEFDANTAQILDIRREKTDNGEWKYISIMTDAKGRRLEVELDSPEAESTYNTIKRLKSNPLADKLYQRIVMPLFDKMLSDPVDSLPTPPPQILQRMPDSEETPAK